MTFTDNVNQIHFISRYLIHELIFKYTLFFELSVQLLCPISLQLVVFHFTELSLFKLCVNQNFVSCVRSEAIPLQYLSHNCKKGIGVQYVKWPSLFHSVVCIILLERLGCDGTTRCPLQYLFHGILRATLHCLLGVTRAVNI